MLLYMTCANLTEAKLIATHLVESKLVAGVNILPEIYSIYRWQNQVHQTSEVVMFAQAPSSNFSAISEAVKSLHSYQNPCIIALSIAQGTPEFLQWIADKGC